MQGEDWQVFGLEQTGQLGIANAEREGVIEVVTACERRDAEAVRRVERNWLQRLFG